MRSTASELFRYGIVGVASNAVGYLLYLALTTIGVESKMAMSALYVAGMAQSFFFNHRWTFQRGRFGGSLARYLIAHTLGYTINFTMLYLLVDFLSFPHQLVQAAAVILVALFLFASFRFWVFKD